MLTSRQGFVHVKSFCLMVMGVCGKEAGFSHVNQFLLSQLPR